MQRLFILIFSLIILGCNNNSDTSNSTIGQMYAPLKNQKLEKVDKTPTEWKAELNEQEFYVLREAGTEYAFTGDLWNNKKEGLYTCRGCGLPLFDSETKFKSGTGWPSFYEPTKKEYITEKVDRAHGMVRVEVVCARCDGHLGHVFPDGPQPTGMRYCINSVSLDFIEEKNLDKKEP